MIQFNIELKIKNIKIACFCLNLNFTANEETNNQTITIYNPSIFCLKILAHNFFYNDYAKSH